MAEKQNQPHDSSLCGARKKQGPDKGKPCRRPAGWGTDHPGVGKCKLHGGASSGAPERNKNAVTTGECETIWTDVLDEVEQSILDRKLDKLKLLEEEIGLLTIRERRMLARIKTLADDEEGMTTVEETAQFGGEGPPVHKVKKVGALGQIQRIEEALTRVQAQKNRAIALKHKLEGEAVGGEEFTPSIRLMPPRGKTI